MDETEVQIEIACWAQDHPEASTINWDNEPWVDFSGPHCTLHLGLGGLTWNIEVPTGYQTKIDPVDEKRKRLWEPLDYGDTVIVPSRSTPFHVSVVDRSNNTLELANGLRQVTNKAGAGSYDEVQSQKIHDMFKALQVAESIPPSMSDAERALVPGNAYLEALKGAETLAKVLDSIHGLAKLYNESKLSSRTEYPDPGRDGDGTFFEDEDDEHIFDFNFTMKWSTIASEVNYAGVACLDAAARFASLSEWVDSDAKSEKLSEENMCGTAIYSPSYVGGTREVVYHLENLTIGSPPQHPNALVVSSDVDDEYTVLLPRSLPGSTDICENSTLQPNDHNASGVSRTEHMYSYDSDSDGSDSSWEITGFGKGTSIREASSGGERGETVLGMRSSPELNSDRQTFSASLNAAQSELEVMWPVDPLTKRERAESRQGSDHCLPSKRMRLEQSKRDTTWGLQWCEIAFNRVSFSVECTLRLSEFMDDITIASALGIALEHPLRVEIVPIKAQVDSLAWTGAVEVYASQHTDWHNHVSEEICGLLCLIPDIVQTYFEDKVPAFIRKYSDHDTTAPKGDLFVGLLQTLVRRLANANAGGFCCVCGKPGERPTLFHMRGKSLWPCSDNLCQATFGTWQEVSSMDIQEREKEDDSQLSRTEDELRVTFSYSQRDALKSALEVYGASADDLNYGQMIKALARIEMWNHKDPHTLPLSYPFFDAGA